MWFWCKIYIFLSPHCAIDQRKISNIFIFSLPCVCIFANIYAKSNLVLKYSCSKYALWLKKQKGWPNQEVEGKAFHDFLGANQPLQITLNVPAWSCSFERNDLYRSLLAFTSVCPSDSIWYIAPRATCHHSSSFIILSSSVLG